MTTRRGQSSRGFALLIVLWSLVLLSLLATGITAAGRSQLQLASNLRRAAAAEAAADGGVYEAMFHLSDPSANAWLPDGSVHHLRVGAYTLEVRVRDEAMFINPNTASPQVFAALLTVLGLDPSRAAALAQSVADWRTPGVRDLAIQQYRSSGMQAAPTGQPFRSIDELGLVIGMTPDLLARLRPHLSVFAEGPVQVAKADPVIQAAFRSIGGAGLATSIQPRVSNIEVDASGADGTRFVRRAIVSLSPSDNARDVGRLLLWDAVAPATQ